MTREVGYEKKTEVEMDRARTEQDGQVVRSAIDVGILVFISQTYSYRYEFILGVTLDSGS
jgi:hypothetical protein